MAKRFLTLLISLSGAIALVQLVGFNSFLHSFTPLGKWLVPVALFIALAVRAVLSILFSAELPTDRMKMPDPSDGIKLAERYEMLLYERYRDDEIIAVVQALLNMPTASQIYEFIELEAESYRREVTVLGNRPSSCCVPWIQPVFWAIKGRPLPKLQIKAETPGVKLMTFAETAGAMSIYCDAIIATLQEEVAPDRQSELKYLGEKIRDIAVRHDYIDNSATGSISNELSEMKLPDSDTKRRLSELISNVGRAYPLLAVVEKRRSHCRIFLSYESGAIYQQARGRLARSTAWVHRLIGSTFGLNERSHQINLSLASMAASYHLNIKAPDGTYIYRSRPEARIDSNSNSKKGLVLKNSDLRASDASFECSECIGGGSVEVYSRDLAQIKIEPSSNNPGPNGVPSSVLQTSITLELRERPPGAIALMAGISLLLSALMFGASVWHDYFFGLDYRDLPDDLAEECRTGIKQLSEEALCKPKSSLSSVSALVFAIPAIVSGWLAGKTSRDTISKLSISTICVSWWVVINVVLTPILVATKMSLPFAKNYRLGGFSTFQFAWTLLLISSISCAIMCCILAVMKSWRYRESILKENGKNRSKSG